MLLAASTRSFRMIAMPGVRTGTSAGLPPRRPGAAAISSWAAKVQAVLVALVLVVLLEEAFTLQAGIPREAASIPVAATIPVAAITPT
mmetsp:Transcript_24061/g.49950  ORF Transcript_24061/g.49950 Transcript_24061/m.49950 type:complete len:88 (-) Transcript_24061:185-448(-)